MTSSKPEHTGCLIVAIDGPSSSGKGMLAKAVAKVFGFTHFDTGRLYRVFAKELQNGHLKVLAGKNCIDEEDEKRILALTLAADPAYSTEEAGKLASILGRNADMRAILLHIQRKFILSSKHGIVVDGRDIASIVCPEAHVKVFVTAYTSIRARRRFKQLKLTAGTRRMMFKQVFFSLLQRDIRDSTRKVAPLTRIEGAFYLNNSHMSEEKSVAELVKKIKTFL
ncbi:(d)CMP kinase [Anaplasma bovis]|uniref:(d)CMP kinase n=1 Tax=Anaplasma bovis TaxID=186733 RepID=UPI002FF20F85